MTTKEKIILQIDDDADDCELFSEALQEVSNAKYHAVYDAAVALTLLRERTIVPDFIFLDLNMPRMNGQEFLLEIKAEPALKDIPVIVFSTSNVQEMKKLTQGLGASDYISKPNDFHAFKEMLRLKLK